MLNTDAHNPVMDTHMTRQDFIAMATSTEEGGAMDLSMLGTIFDRVVEDEIRMTDARKPKAGGAGGAGKRSGSTPGGGGGSSISTSLMSGAAAEAAAAAAKEAKEAAARAVDSLASTLNLATPWKRRDAAAEASAESEAVLRETRELFRSSRGGGASGGGASAFFAASEPGLARPMLEAAATPLLRALEGAFAAAEDGAHAALPLEGARAALRLSAQLQLPDLRDALAAFLTSAPGIGQATGMAPQGAEAVATLLELATRETGMLGGCWAAVLEVVSRLDELQGAAAANGVLLPSGNTNQTPTLNMDMRSANEDVALTNVRAGNGDRAGDGVQGIRSPLRIAAKSTSALGPGITGPARTASGVINTALSNYGGSGPLTPGKQIDGSGQWSVSGSVVARNLFGASSGSSGDRSAAAAAGSRSAVSTSAANSTAAGARLSGNFSGTSLVSTGLGGGGLNPVEEQLAHWLSEGAGAEIVGRVFSESTRLDSDEVVVYTGALAEVARTELWAWDGTPLHHPRTYSLRRLVDVSTVNMERVRMVWTRVWHVVSTFLVAAVAHPDERVARESAEGLQRVATKLLQRAAATG
jgi:hypothetical protein